MSRLKKSSYAAALAVSLIGTFEGLRETAYPDVIGVPTICYGETKGVHLGDHKTKAQCDAMFVKRLDEFATHIEACVKKPMSDKTEVAFVSLGYNIGYGGFCKSSVVRNYNAGKYTEACEAMNAYNRAGGHVLRALVTRRSAESRLCLEGIQ